MKLPRHFTFPMLALAACSTTNAATILDFSGTGTDASSTPIPAGWGSNVPDVGGVTGVTVTSGQGTPNIALSWSAAGGIWQRYNDATWTAVQLDGASAGDTFTLAFTPSGGFGVQINSFNFDPYGTGGTYAFEWAVFSGTTGGTLMAGGPVNGVVSSFTTNTTVNVNFAATDNQAYRLVLTRTGGAGTGSSIAVDNISFGQTAVPEPAGALLAATGLGALALRRRRK